MRLITYLGKVHSPSTPQCTDCTWLWRLVAEGPAVELPGTLLLPSSRRHTYSGDCKQRPDLAFTRENSHQGVFPQRLNGKEILQPANLSSVKGKTWQAAMQCRRRRKMNFLFPSCIILTGLVAPSVECYCRVSSPTIPSLIKCNR